jgi:hypothetical protein
MADRTYHLQTGRVVLAGAAGDALQRMRIDLLPDEESIFLVCCDAHSASEMGRYC